MAAKKTKSAPSQHMEWYVECNEKCGGKQQRVLFARIVGDPARRKALMCAGCREYLPPDAKTFKE